MRKRATRISAVLVLPKELRETVILAAKFHDLGKKREAWQRSIGNPDPKNWLAKSGRGMKPVDLTTYRHEFGSLADVLSEPEFRGLTAEAKDMLLHFIAAHHGRGRPHFPLDEVFDPENSAEVPAAIAIQVPQRFARLQRKFGRWGLAYLESVLRAADYAASAQPSNVAENRS